MRLGDRQAFSPLRNVVFLYSQLSPGRRGHKRTITARSDDTQHTTQGWDEKGVKKHSFEPPKQHSILCSLLFPPPRFFSAFPIFAPPATPGLLCCLDVCTRGASPIL